MNKKILILANSDGGLYNFRKELLEELIDEGFQVVVSTPFGTKIDLIKEIGCIVKEVKIDRHGVNPINEMKLLKYYWKLIKDIQPDVILTYTIKPNIYGGLIAQKLNIPYIANITGLGTAVENPGLLQKIATGLYKRAFSDVNTVFFQNEENRQYFEKNKIALNQHKLIPGSGVNLKEFNLLAYPSTDKNIEFLFISRIMKQKGIDQYLEAAKAITDNYSNIKFHVVGAFEEEYQDIIGEYQQKEIIQYHGVLSNVREILKITHCTVHPTYYPEGMSNVLLESAASARPVITTNRSGTKEIVNDGETGYLIREKDSNDLINKIEQFINLPFEKKKEMGLAGRKKVENEFSRQIVVDSYINEIYSISKHE